MDLLQNPFHILTASPRDNRMRILELAEERSLLQDSSECINARSELTTPRKRLSAEIAWLPGVGPKKSDEVLSLLTSAPTVVLAIENIPATARANLLAAGLIRLPDCNAADVATWILEIAKAFEHIKFTELCASINEERVAAGFPKVSDTSTIEAEIQIRRAHYRNTIKSALDNLPPKELVKTVTNVIDVATHSGLEHGPTLIDDLVDLYEVGAQEFFEKEESNIKILVEKLREAVDAKCPDSMLAPLVDQLICVVKNWDIVAQPIQVSTKSRGLGHEASQRIAYLVRGLAIHMFNEHDKLDFSQQLTNMLQEVFAEVGEIAERTAQDACTLSALADQQVRTRESAKDKAEEWRQEISYEAEVGAIFKDKLLISPEGIEWKGYRWSLDSITKIRWGGTRHSINGIPTGTTYSVVFGNNSGNSTVSLRNKNIYSNFTDRLWRAVGVRLLIELFEGLSDGKQYRFGSAVLSDHGMELERKSFFSNTEHIFCRWSELAIWNGPGVFCIGKREDKGLSMGFSYIEEDNIHVLEAAIRTLWKKGGDRLSCIFTK
ncbi:MAG: hypothetical protein F8N36_08575 [Desulfovibrio sp.]|uniref:hypothetical protein n=1 Tax=Desulfovibrio sp. TaxID=885 RepID=UPI00135E80F7|nr:hypothetical protein [Desulfovibrio sp.]MTJ92899.1 hypothetical protein [Desulfovibrio sp.]